MTSAPARVAPAPNVDDAAAAHPVAFMTVMNPPELSEHLFGCGDGAPRIAGTAALNERPFSTFTSSAARAALAEAEVLITAWGAPALTEDDLAAAPHLRYVIHAGGQASTLLPHTAAAERILLSNAGWVNAIPVAEFTVAMIVLANKDAFRSNRIYLDKRAWVDREQTFPQAGNAGKTIGVVGASRIGRIVIERLGTMDLNILVHDPYLASADAARLGVRITSLDELMASSDVVTLHPPLTPSTAGMIGRDQLKLLRDGATLINTARGPIVDQDALIEELSAGRIEAILDVTTPDPLPAESPLYELPNVFLTPHISGSMGTEIRRLGQHVLGELERIAAGAPLSSPEVLH